MDKQTVLDRARVCATCEHLFKPMRVCKKCGCSVVLKVRIAQSSCPVDKWQEA